MEFGDVVFYSILLPILIIIFWLAFVEQFFPLWGAWIVSVIVDIYIFSKYKYRKSKKANSEIEGVE